MAGDHVGITRLVEDGFAVDHQTFCYDHLRNVAFHSSTKNLGTEKHYYDEDVENGLLANNIEHQFGLFYNAFCKTTDVKRMASILKENEELVTQYFSFMFCRSKKALEGINKSTLSSKVFGDLSHSDFLRIQSVINVNPLQLIGEKYSFYPVINFSKVLFINNSLGFSIMTKNRKITAIFIPLNVRVGILVTDIKELEGSECTSIEPDADNKAFRMNISICNTEIEIGNGFIFGSSEQLLEPYVSHMKELLKLNDQSTFRKESQE